MKEWNGDGLLPTLYSKTATGAVNVWQCWVEKDEVCVRWGQMDGALQTARFRCEPKNEGRSNATTGNEQAIKEAKAKWKKQIKKKYSETLETAGETQRIKPMLATDWQTQRHSIRYPVSMQPKLDGVRCLAYLKDGKAYLQSRGGDPWLLPHIQRELWPVLSKDTVLDGELYIHGMSLQNITSLAKKPREESVQLYYCVYDIFSLSQPNATWDMRKSWVLVWFGERQQGFNKVVRLDTNLASCEADVLYLQRSYVEMGYEGGIIRTPHGVYRQGYRSPDLLKVKSWQDAEYPIVNWTVGKGKFENAPIFTCMTAQGKHFEVVPKGTAEERLEMLREAPTLIGKFLKVQFLDFTDDGAPKCARGIAIRDPSDM